MAPGTRGAAEAHPQATVGLRPSAGMMLAARRVLAAVPVLFGVSIVTFFVTNLLPGSAAQQLLGADATPEQVAQLEARLNIDRPGWERYAEWLQGLLTGDLGHSLASGQPVVSMLGERLPVTAELLAYAFLIALGLAVPMALLSARAPNRGLDRLSMASSMLTLSLPNYVLAVLLVLVAAVYVPLFPSIGFTPLTVSVTENLRALTLPAVAIGLPLFGLYNRFLRRDLLEQLRGEEYVVAARARGVGLWRILIRHALPNSVFGLITVVGLNIGTLIGGTVVIEQIFALPGVGTLLLQAVNTRDTMVVQGVVLVVAVVTVSANLLVDLTYSFLDPRIRYGARRES